MKCSPSYKLCIYAAALYTEPFQYLALFLLPTLDKNCIFEILNSICIFSQRKAFRLFICSVFCYFWLCFYSVFWENCPVFRVTGNEKNSNLATCRLYWPYSYNIIPNDAKKVSYYDSRTISWMWAITKWHYWPAYIEFRSIKLVS